jgi:hypothetical protein
MSYLIFLVTGLLKINKSYQKHRLVIKTNIKIIPLIVYLFFYLVMSNTCYLKFILCVHVYIVGGNIS